MKNGTGSALAVQIATGVVSGALVALSALALSGWALGAAHGLGQWALWPCAGAWTAYRCARKGIPAICSWPLPAMLAAGSYWLIVGLPPSAGAVVLCALVSLAFAAAGEVRGKWHKSKGR